MRQILKIHKSNNTFSRLLQRETLRWLHDDVRMLDQH